MGEHAYGSIKRALAGQRPVETKLDQYIHRVVQKNRLPAAAQNTQKGAAAAAPFSQIQPDHAQGMPDSLAYYRGLAGQQGGASDAQALAVQRQEQAENERLRAARAQQAAPAAAPAQESLPAPRAQNEARARAVLKDAGDADAQLYYNAAYGAQEAQKAAARAARESAAAQQAAAPAAPAQESLPAPRAQNEAQLERWAQQLQEYHDAPPPIYDSADSRTYEQRKAAYDRVVTALEEKYDELAGQLAAEDRAEQAAIVQQVSQTDIAAREQAILEPFKDSPRWSILQKPYGEISEAEYASLTAEEKHAVAAKDRALSEQARWDMPEVMSAADFVAQEYGTGDAARNMAEKGRQAGLAEWNRVLGDMYTTDEVKQVLRAYPTQSEEYRAALQYALLNAKAANGLQGAAAGLGQSVTGTPAALVALGNYALGNEEAVRKYADRARVNSAVQAAAPLGYLAGTAGGDALQYFTLGKLGEKAAGGAARRLLGDAAESGAGRFAVNLAGQQAADLLVQAPKVIGSGIAQGKPGAEIGRDVLVDQAASLLENALMMGLENWNGEWKTNADAFEQNALQRQNSPLDWELEENPAQSGRPGWELEGNSAQSSRPGWALEENPAQSSRPGWNRWEKYDNINTAVVPTERGTVIYRRVQGGKSWQRITVQADGTLRIGKHKDNISISAYTGEHAAYFLDKRGEGAYIIEFEVPLWFDEFVREYAIRQDDARSNPKNQGGMAPKFVDPTMPGYAYEFPPPWIEWLEQYATNARIITTLE